MSDTPKRRWLRFSLRTMFVAFTAIAIWLGWTSRLVHERRAVLDDSSRFWPIFVDPKSSLGKSKPSISLIRQLMGDRAVEQIAVYRSASEDDIELATELFPEAHVFRLKMRYRGEYW